VESNPVPITEWRGTVKVTFTPGLGSLQARTELDVRFRADLHKFRTNISDTPDDRTVDVYVSGASTGNIKASGVYVTEDGQITYHDGGELDMYGKNVIDVFAGFSSGAANLAITETSGQFGGLITLNPKSNRAGLCLVMQSFHPVTIQADGASGESIGVIVLPGPEGVQDRLRGALGCVDVPFQNYTIPSGTRTVNIEGATYKLEWTSFQPVAAPTEQTPG
jgi:hypothetical protein